MKLRMILREAGMELMTRHLTTCPTLYTVPGSAPGSNPSSNLLLHQIRTMNILQNNTNIDITVKIY